MTDDRHAEELADRALHRLRDTIMTGAVPPPAASLRTHANRWLRARRATAGGLAAAAVAALALGGTAVWQPTAAPPGPAGSPSPTAPATVPIDQVNWATATVNLPPGYGCPPGPAKLALQEEGISYNFDDPAAAAGLTGIEPYEWRPQPVAFWLDPAPTYGDLTGDGQPEAVLRAVCFEDADRGAADDGLLVVTREPDGGLAGLGWVSQPEGAREPFWTTFQAFWVAGDRLLADASQRADPGTVLGQDAHLAHPPGQALGYHWDGERMVEDGPVAEYPPVLAADGGAGAPIRLGPVADGLGCPDTALRFTLSDQATVPGQQPGFDFSGGGTARSGDRVYLLRPNHNRQHLFDLDGSGERRLLVTIECQPTGGSRTEGLAVFERDSDGWQGVAVVSSPVEPAPAYLYHWWPDGTDVVLSWAFDPACTTECDDLIERVTDRRYRWTGSELVPVDE